MAMHPRIGNLKKRYEALQTRERLLVVGALLTVVYLVWLMLVSNAQRDNRTRLEAELYAVQQQRSALASEYHVLVDLSARDPLAHLERELQSLRENIAESEKKLESLAVGLVSPRRLPLVMREVLRAQDGVQLITLRTLPSQEVVLEAAPAEDGQPQEAGVPGDALKLYRHGVQMVFQSRFHAVQHYLKVLEASEWQFYWSAIDYRVTDYPMAEVHLNVYTLSASRSGRHD